MHGDSGGSCGIIDDVGGDLEKSNKTSTVSAAKGSTAAAAATADTAANVYTNNNHTSAGGAAAGAASADAPSSGSDSERSQSRYMLYSPTKRSRQPGVGVSPMLGGAHTHVIQIYPCTCTCSCTCTCVHGLNLTKQLLAHTIHIHAQQTD